MVTQTVSQFIQPKIVVSAPQSKIHGRIVTTKIVGVSFENRQEVVARLQVGDRIWLEREPNNPFDRNAIMVCCNNGDQVGYLSAKLAASIAYLFDRYGKPVHGKVHLLTGSSFDNYSLGVIILFKLPRLRKPNQLADSDWDE
jgi:hypothetical protein